MIRTAVSCITHIGWKLTPTWILFKSWNMIFMVFWDKCFIQIHLFFFFILYFQLFGLFGFPFTPLHNGKLSHWLAKNAHWWIPLCHTLCKSQAAWNIPVMCYCSLWQRSKTNGECWLIFTIFSKVLEFFFSSLLLILDFFCHHISCILSLIFFYRITK